MQLNGKVILQTIADNEAKVAQLYKAIASEAKKGDVFFENLAKDEERHNKIYHALMNKLPDDGALELEEEQANYLNLLIEQNFLNDNSLVEKASKIIDKREIFELAERVERDAVIWVTELQNIYPDLATEEMKIVLKEEKSHLMKVLERKKESQPLFGRGM